MFRFDTTPSLTEEGDPTSASRSMADGKPRSLFVFRGSKRTTVLWAVLLIGSIAVVDRRLTESVPLGFMYLLPMLMLGRVVKPWQIMLAAALCTFLAEQFDPFGWALWTGLSRDLLYFMAFFSIGAFVYQVSKSRQTMMRQLSEIRQQTAARLEAELQLKALVESSPAAIITTDADGRILMANDAAHRLLGLKEPLLLGRLLQTYFPSFANVTMRETSQQLFRTMMQSRGHREDGESFLAEVCFSTYQTSAGHRLAAMILDSSEEFRTREESSLHQMLAGSRMAVNAVSHEIRNVCGAIAAVHRNFASRLRIVGDSDFEALGNLVMALERIASVELRPYPEQATQLDLEAILDDLRIVIGPSLEDHQIAFTLSVEPSLPLVWGDGTNLMQVFLNLTTNSIRALSETALERMLTINAKRQEDRVRVEVIDSGGGIADTSRLFRPFQVGARNTGLGLYLARAFARSFGGDIHYEAVPGGACFVVEMALVQEGLEV